MDFSINISPLVWSLLAVALLAAIIGALWGLKNMRAFARIGRRMAAQPVADLADDKLPGVSVIVYAKNVEESIREYLQSLLEQDYPEYEVIVINDASIDNTAEIVDSMLGEDERLHYSFVPESSRNVSRRKVALTIGAKAAKYPVLIMTNAHSRMPSREWLRRMAVPFASPYTEFSLGASAFPAERDKGFGKYFRRYDSLLRLAQWMGSAMGGAPYRGDAFALGYKKDTFFNNQGFAHTNRFVAGEDDLYVNEHCNSGNTQVVFHPETFVSQEFPEDEYPRLWLRDKERYTFTQRYLNTNALRLQALHSLCAWLTLLLSVAAAWVAWPNLLPMAIALIICLLAAAYEICVYRRAAALTGDIKLCLTVPLFVLMRPIIGALLRIRFRANKASNYTWKHAK